VITDIVGVQGFLVIREDQFKIIPFKIGSVMHIARMRETRKAYTILVGNVKGRRYLEDRSLHNRIILKLILNMWAGCMRQRIATNSELGNVLLVT
jgi:hypothetical protein